MRQRRRRRAKSISHAAFRLRKPAGGRRLLASERACQRPKMRPDEPASEWLNSIIASGFQLAAPSLPLSLLLLLQPASPPACFAAVSRLLAGYRIESWASLAGETRELECRLATSANCLDARRMSARLLYKADEQALNCRYHNSARSLQRSRSILFRVSLQFVIALAQ